MPMPTPDRYPPDDLGPPPDPQKVLGQVIVDVGCLLVSLALAAFVWAVVDGFAARVRVRVAAAPGLPLERALPAIPALLVLALGAQLRLWVRELVGVDDTARDPADATVPDLPPPAPVAVPPAPAECPRCAGTISASRSDCPACGWSGG